MFRVINECTRRESLILNKEEIVNIMMFMMYQFPYSNQNEMPTTKNGTTTTTTTRKKRRVK